MQPRALLCGPWAERWATDVQYGNLNGPDGTLARLLREYGIYCGGRYESGVILPV